MGVKTGGGLAGIFDSGFRKQRLNEQKLSIKQKEDVDGIYYNRD